MPESNIAQSNVFGDASTSNTAGPSPFNTSETTAAGKLIDYLKYLSDIQLEKMTNRAGWLGIAANQGQNTANTSLVNRELKQPDKLERALHLTDWNVPAINAQALSLPPIPEELKIDMGKLSTDLKTDIDRLQTLWIGKLIPATTDLAPLNSLHTYILNGTNAGQVETRLAALLEELKQALRTATDAAMARLETLSSASESSLSSNFDDAKTQLGAALEVARDETGTIAWNRARDQAAREAARQEAEAVSAWAARGFSLPGGALTAIAGRARQATLKAASEMAAVQAEKTQQQFIDIATRYVDAYLRHMDSRVNGEIAYYREATAAKLRATELELDANKFKAKMAFDNLGLTLDFTKFAGKLAIDYRLDVQRTTNDLVRAYASLRDSDRSTMESLAQSRLNQQNAVLDYYRAAIGAAEVGLRLDITNTETDLRWAQIAASFIGQAVGHHVQAASGAAEVFSRVAGMALSGMVGIASTTAS